MYKVLVGKPEGKRRLGRPGVGWKMGSDWNLGRLALGVWIGFDWLRTGTGQAVVSVVMNLRVLAPRSLLCNVAMKKRLIRILYKILTVPMAERSKA
jgi:hypothetical protein